MPNLPRKKIGLIACSGEEFPEGTVTRRAVREVLERLRPDDTVTLCLPLFLAGGEGERSFARHYPTIAIDGCSKRCAALATEKYSARPAASIVVSEVAVEAGCGGLGTARRLNSAGKALAEKVAERIAAEVDRLLKKNRKTAPGPAAPSCACACGSELPSGMVKILGQPTRVTALPLIFAKFKDEGRVPAAETAKALLETVKIYNEVSADQDDAYREALLKEYSRFLREDR